MGPSTRRQPLFFATVVLACATPATGAEIYKWVDEQGRTHYSQRDDSVGKTKASQVKVAVPPPETAPPAGSDSRGFDERRPVKSPVEPPSAGARPAPSRASTPWRGHAVETDASKCKLARAVISGAVRHGNGAPTDDYDRQVAQNDIRAFCGK